MLLDRKRFENFGIFPKLINDEKTMASSIDNLKNLQMIESVLFLTLPRTPNVAETYIN